VITEYLKTGSEPDRVSQKVKREKQTFSPEKGTPETKGNLDPPGNGRKRLEEKSRTEQWRKKEGKKEKARPSSKYPKRTEKEARRSNEALIVRSKEGKRSYNFLIDGLKERRAPEQGLVSHWRTEKSQTIGESSILHYYMVKEIIGTTLQPTSLGRGGKGEEVAPKVKEGKVHSRLSFREAGWEKKNLSDSILSKKREGGESKIN